MKHILTILLTLFLTTLVYGQTSIVVHGGVTAHPASTSGYAGLNFTITVYDSNTTVVSSGVTDQYGVFYDTIALTSGLGVFPVVFEFLDCNGAVYADTTATTATNFLVYGGNHYYCPDSICDPVFTTSVINDTLVTHTIANPTFGSTYNWSLSNGTTFTDSIVNYSINTYGQYTMCVTQTNQFVSCVADTCHTFIAGVPPCDATFGTVITNDTLVSHSINNPNASSTYTWILSNGATFGGTNVNHVIDNIINPGTYVMCVTQTDTVANCTVTECDTFVILPPVVTCDASFTTSVVSDSLVTHTITSPVATAAYYWHLPDGSNATGTSVSYVLNTYSTSHLTMVDMYDSLTFCTDSVLYTFTAGIPPTGNCDPTFTTSVVSDTSVTHTVSNINPGAWYIWHLPNGSTTSGTSVNYVMNAYDSAYVVCLVVVDTATNCTDSLCMTFAAGIIPVPPVNGISGTVSNASGTPAGSAMVYLIDLINDSSGIILVAVDSTTTVQGTYSFTNIPLGNYFVKAALLSSDPSYTSYLPSYFANSTNSLGALHWTNAATVSVPQTGMVSVSFNLVQGTNPGGPGFIGGFVSQGANKTAAEGDAISGVLVILLDENDNPVAYTLSNAQGEFEFDNIAFGTYTVYAEVPGIPTTPGTVTLSAEKPNTNQVRIEVNSSYIFTYVSSSTGFDNLSEVVFDVYPNPMRDEVTIISSTDEAGKSALVEIYDINGKSVLRENISLAGTNKINTSEISSGYYLIQIQTQTNTTTIRLVK